MIRLATLNDLDEVVRIHKATINNMKNPYKLFKIIIKKGNCYVYADPEVRGAITFDINRMQNPYNKDYGRQKIFWLDQLIIDPTHQGKGLGSKLMVYMIQKSTLQKRFVCNLDLIEYYKGFGFIVHDIVTINQRDQAIMLLE
ncbi:GNAT family N-acetyltransferase [candidate division WOR-3 bacterium]|nr:GNAT family N-acetyltransferase [candidate division WOR-3 bacterium]